MNINNINFPTDLLFNITDYLGNFAASTLSHSDKTVYTNFKAKFKYKDAIDIDKIPENMKNKVIKIFNYKGENLYDYKSLHEVTMNNEFNKKILFQLPQYVTTFTIGENFNKSLRGILPNNLLYLYMNHGYSSFNHKLPTLPKSLIHLQLSSVYNQELHLADTSIETLQIGNNNDDYNISNNSFNQLLDNLPNTLTHLNISCREFNQSLSDLPDSITYIELYSDVFNHPILKLPNSLTKLEMWCTLFDNYLNYLPIKLNYLSLESQKFNTPIDLKYLNQLTYLNLSCYHFNKSLDNLPLSLTTLDFTSTVFNQPLNKLSNSLTILNLNIGYEFETNNGFNNIFNQSLDNLPASLTKLHLMSSFKNPIDKLPINLQSLTIINDNFNQSLDTLPLTLTSLELYGRNINTPVDHLPSNLTKLIIQSDLFNHLLYSLPQNLNELILRGNDIRGDTLNLPDNLQILDIINASSFNINSFSSDSKLSILKMTLKNVPSDTLTYPSTLKELDIDKTDNSDRIDLLNALYKLPSKLVKLRIKIDFSMSLIEKFIPKELQELYIYNPNNYCFINKLPRSLTKLDITFADITLKLKGDQIKNSKFTLI